MTARPPWQELPEVVSGELVIRLIRPNEYKADAPAGARVQPAAIPTDEFKPNDRSYGASAFVKSRLRNGLKDIVDANPKWNAYVLAEVMVEKIRELGIEVRLSPQDCEYEQIRDAHASLINLNRDRRNKLVRLLEAHLVPNPSSASAAS